MFLRRRGKGRKKLKWLILLVIALLIAAFFFSRYQARQQFVEDINAYRWYLPADVLRGRRLVVREKRFWLLDRSGSVFDNGRVRVDSANMTLHILTPLTKGTLQFQWGDNPSVAARYTTRFASEVVAHGKLRQGKKIDNDDVKIPKGKTPQEAARYGDLVSVKHFLDQGWGIDDQSKSWTTMLGMAAYYAHTEVVTWLIEKKANVNATSNDGKPVLLLAIETGHIPTLHALLSAENIEKNQQDQDGNGALTTAVKFGHVDVLKMLVQHGFDLQKKDEYGNNLLHLALSQRDLSSMAFVNNTNMLRYLIDAGVSPNAVNEDGVSAIRLAEQQGQTDALVLLTGISK